MLESRPGTRVVHTITRNSQHILNIRTVQHLRVQIARPERCASSAFTTRVKCTALSNTYQQSNMMHHQGGGALQCPVRHGYSG